MGSQTRERGGRPVDLLCSRNARSQTPLVGRAQWEIKQVARPYAAGASLEGAIRWGVVVRCAQARIDQAPLKRKKKSSMLRAVGGHRACPQRKK